MTDEDRGERINRELLELLNELRVALPGVQVLLAFLLIVPFQEGFSRLDAGDRRVYFTAVVLTVLSSALFMAPTAHHRMLFRKRTKEAMVKAANVFALVGAFLLALALAATVYVITSVVYGDGPAVWWAGGLGGFMALLWFVVPLLFPTRAEDGDGPALDRSAGAADDRKGARSG